MVYGCYIGIRNATWQALLDFNVCSLPVSVSKITKQLGIRLVGNKRVNLLNQGERGATTYVNNQWYIVVNESEQIETQRFTAAHAFSLRTLHEFYKRLIMDLMFNCYHSFER